MTIVYGNSNPVRYWMLKKSCCKVCTASRMVIPVKRDGRPCPAWREQVTRREAPLVPTPPTPPLQMAAQKKFQHKTRLTIPPLSQGRSGEQPQTVALPEFRIGRS